MSVQMPCYHSYHCALVAIIYAEGGEELKQYRRQTQQFPLSLPHGPRIQLDAGYKELLQHVVCPPLRECPANKMDHQHDMKGCQLLRNATKEGHALPSSSAQPWA